VHLAREGFDFLGFNARRYHGKLLIKPSKAAIKRIRRRLAVELRRLRRSNAKAVLATIVPITRGWAAYYRGVVSKEVFNSLDDYILRSTVVGRSRHMDHVNMQVTGMSASPNDENA